ncbi:hypothetical protein K490DRAFT_63070 [Saccharata proteae CBS 121410]|uniref:Uncharacterized protein n=1 Tax=Saccharata proteae CBS 121410 TaxID=1314787 RepID=A0A9P4I0C0_9PEZI|nr:hypothetical protein K490DRAFT_63070 [Saccharata proteae CBS 121410]
MTTSTSSGTETLPPYTEPPEYETEADDQSEQGGHRRHRGHIHNRTVNAVIMSPNTSIELRTRSRQNPSRPLSYQEDYRPIQPSHLRTESNSSAKSLSSQPGPIVDTYTPVEYRSNHSRLQSSSTNPLSYQPGPHDHENEEDGQPGHAQTAIPIHFSGHQRLIRPVVRLGDPTLPPPSGITGANRADNATPAPITNDPDPAANPTKNSSLVLSTPPSITYNYNIRSAWDILQNPASNDIYTVHLPDIPRTCIFSTGSLTQDSISQYEAPLRHGFTDVWIQPHQPGHAPPYMPVVQHTDAPNGVAFPTLHVSPGIRTVAEDVVYVLVLQGSMGALRQKVVLRYTQREVVREIFAAGANGYSVVFSAGFLREDVPGLMDPGMKLCLVGNGDVESLRGLKGQRQGNVIGLLC